MSAVNAKHLAPLCAKLARSDDLVQRALAAVLVAEDAAGIDGICARLSQLRGQIDALCRQRETCLLRVDAQARVPLGVCCPVCLYEGQADAAFETRFVMGIAQLEEEYHMLCAREAYLREHCTDVEKAHKALFNARRGLHSAQEALAEALRC